MRKKLLMLLTSMLCLPSLGFAADNVPAAVLSTQDRNTKTLTFTMVPSSTQMVTDGSDGTYAIPSEGALPGWCAASAKSSIRTVTFDKSFAEARPTNLARWFAGLENLATINGIENLNTSEATTMDSLFAGCRGLFYIDLTHFNTAKVTDMASMFAQCSNLGTFRNQPLDFSSFNTSNVTDMTDMFNNDAGLQVADISSFDMSKIAVVNGVYKASRMFMYCSSMKELSLGNNSFKGAKESDRIFENVGFFIPTDQLVKLTVGPKFDKSVLGDDLGGYYYWLGGYFTAPTVVDVKEDSIPAAVLSTQDRNTKTLTFTMVPSSTQMVSDGSDGTYAIPSEGALPGWCATSAKSSIRTVTFDKSFAEARPTNLARWFAGLENLATINGIENLNTSEATTMDSLFTGCRGLFYIDLTHFNTAKVTDMASMFAQCSNLGTFRNQPLDFSSFNTSNVTDMTDMFNNDAGLQVADISSFDMSKIAVVNGVYKASRMFMYCSSMKELSLGNNSFKDAKESDQIFENVGFFIPTDQLVKLTVGPKFDKSVLGDDLGGYYYWLGGYFTAPTVVDGINGVKANADKDNIDETAYNLAGQRIGKSYKGIVIVNGKKYLNK